MKLGEGTQILSGVNTLTGDSVGGNSGTAVFVREGSLIVTGSIVGRAINDPTDLRGNVGVVGSGILGGTGLINGDVSINEFGTLDPGATRLDPLTPGSGSIGTLTVGSLSLTSQTGVRFQLTLAGAIGGAAHDLVNILGDFYVNGFLEIFPRPGFGPGVYRLFNYGGDLNTDEGVFTISFLDQYPQAYVDYSKPGQIDLVIPVPEPASALAVLSGAGLLLGRRRRRSA